MPETPLSITALGESYVRHREWFSEFLIREEVSERLRIFKLHSLAKRNEACGGKTKETPGAIKKPNRKLMPNWKARSALISDFL
jgi:hypothetical protein